MHRKGNPRITGYFHVNHWASAKRCFGTSLLALASKLTTATGLGRRPAPVPPARPGPLLSGTQVIQVGTAEGRRKPESRELHGVQPPRTASRVTKSWKPARPVSRWSPTHVHSQLCEPSQSILPPTLGCKAAYSDPIFSPCRPSSLRWLPAAPLALERPPWRGGAPCTRGGRSAVLLSVESSWSPRTPITYFEVFRQPWNPAILLPKELAVRHEPHSLGFIGTGTARGPVGLLRAASSASPELTRTQLQTSRQMQQPSRWSFFSEASRCLLNYVQRGLGLLLTWLEELTPSFPLPQTSSGHGILSAKHQMLFLRLSVSLQTNEWGGVWRTRSPEDFHPSWEGHSTTLGSKCKLVAFRHFWFCRVGGGRDNDGWGEGIPKKEFK